MAADRVSGRAEQLVREDEERAWVYEAERLAQAQREREHPAVLGDPADVLADRAAQCADVAALDTLRAEAEAAGLLDTFVVARAYVATLDDEWINYCRRHLAQGRPVPERDRGPAATAWTAR